MHRLDGYINDIEPRIIAICENASKQEEPSLQVALCSYGWILLDSWVAWRTLRFILRDADIEMKVQNKWFQTPSSYTASQIKAIWGFTDTVEEFVKQQTGKKLKDVFDNTIQTKRNASAHFTKDVEVTGQDSRLIKQLFEILSKVFLLYENSYFWKEISLRLENVGYRDFEVEFPDSCHSCRYKIIDFKDALWDYYKSERFNILCKNKAGEEFVINVSKDGCDAGKYCENSGLGPICNNKQETYSFYKSKGYYQNIPLFLETLLKVWNS